MMFIPYIGHNQLSSYDHLAEFQIGVNTDDYIQDICCFCKLISLAGYIRWAVITSLYLVLQALQYDLTYQMLCVKECFILFNVLLSASSQLFAFCLQHLDSWVIMRKRRIMPLPGSDCWPGQLYFFSRWFGELALSLAVVRIVLIWTLIPQIVRLRADLKSRHCYPKQMVHFLLSLEYILCLIIKLYEYDNFY